MSRFPVVCSECGAEYNSRDEMDEVSKGDMQYLYCCVECSWEVLGVTVKRGEVLDSRVF